MNSIKSNIVCVLRPAGDGAHQWMNIEGRTDLKAGEATLTGTFEQFEVRTGPSGSHVHICYEPVNAKRGQLATPRVLTCVLREVGKEGVQWVSAFGRVDLRVGERTLTGTFTDFTAKSGPSGSHIVTCHLPVKAVEGTYEPEAEPLAA